MENEDTVRFFDKYFKNMEDSKSAIIYVKLYRALQHKYHNLNHEEISKYLAIYIMHYVMKDPNLRSDIIKSAFNKIIKN